VYAFINQLKALVPLKSEEVVRANLPSCLREAAARWYSAELSDEERQDLSVRSLPLGWYATLERRFKPRPTEALTKVMSPASIYSWRDVRAGRSVTEWAQNMLRDAQAADITGTTTLLRMVWTRLEPARGLKCLDAPDHVRHSPSPRVTKVSNSDSMVLPVTATIVPVAPVSELNCPSAPIIRTQELTPLSLRGIRIVTPSSSDSRSGMSTFPRRMRHRPRASVRPTRPNNKLAHSRDSTSRASNNNSNSPLVICLAQTRPASSCSPISHGIKLATRTQATRPVSHALAPVHGVVHKPPPIWPTHRKFPPRPTHRASPIRPKLT
jgi:hypothetical protein